MGLEKCRDCGKEISPTAGKCPFCGAKWSTPSQAYLIFIILVGWAAVFLYIFLFPDNPTPTPLKPSAEQAETKSEKAAPTTQELIEATQKALADGYKPDKDPMKARWGDLETAEKQVLSIRNVEDEKQKEEIRKLNFELMKRKVELNKQVEILATQTSVLQRDNIRETLDKFFLNRGMDVRIILEGRDKDTIRFKYILWSRPMVYKFTNGWEITSGSFLHNLKQAGFKKVLFDDTVDGIISFDF